MIPVSLSVFVTLFAATGIGGLFFLWIYYDRMGLRAQHRLNQTVFHCTRCGKLYGMNARVKRASCPACGFDNIPLRF